MALSDSRRGLRLAAVIAALATATLLALAGWELFREFERGRVLRAEVERSHETRAQILRVFSLLQDAETGQRGFVITGQDQFLGPYVAARGELSNQMADLAELFEGHPVQAADYVGLADLVEAKEQTLEEGISIRRDQGQDAAIAYVSTGVGKTAMDRIRVVVDRMVEAEAGFLESLSARSEARSGRAEAMVVGVFAILVAVVIGTAFLMWRYVRTRRSLLGRVQATVARQQAIFDSAIDAIVTLNPSGSIESINAAGERMFGWSAAELDRRDVAVLVDLAGEGEGAFLKRLGASHGALQGGIVRELTARRRDGATFPVDVALGIMELPTGSHIVAVVRDISERRRIEEMKEQFVSTVSHELRTPLTSIAGSLGLLAGGAAGALPDKAQRLIGIAHANSQRLVRLINDILDVEKIESGKLLLEMSPLDLRAIAERSLESAAGYAEERSVSLVLRDGPAAPVRGDADRLIQVVVNLLSNAAKFSPAGGEVVVCVDPQTRIARLSVIDQGPGIPDEFRSRIFGKFAQADASDTRAKGGTGLGLAISREIAERHGGRLWFESTPGEGATFHLDLPLVAEVEAREGEGPRLLIVEDDADAAEVLATMLVQDGFIADTARTAREGLAAARRGGYAAVLVDLNLPDADGIGLIRALRASPDTHELPVVVVSADVTRGRARGASLEVVDWMEKPFNQDRLRAAVDAVLARSQSRRPVVLHIDDDRDILEVTASALGSAVEMTSAVSLADARQSLARRRPDLVILDLGLPDGSGLELLSDLKDEADEPIPVVIYSAQEMDAALAGRAEAVLTKSRTSLASLARTVRRLTLQPRSPA
ncbi:CHASE3 domain-containing protein [Brevundimonas lutea]|uniref:CHASE3 domain-containing protein n=1 Tax=Brevundimonas lutea TaxID=2293980 RepID=UPI000F016B4A|nr:CHASE3 domain-containing protein [Brevundimonas lutea]